MPIVGTFAQQADQLFAGRVTGFESSNVEGFAYNVEGYRLFIWFLNGSRYCYDAMPKAKFEGMKAASSKGSFLDAEIKKGGWPKGSPLVHGPF